MQWITPVNVNKDFGFSEPVVFVVSVSDERADMLCQIRGLHLMVKPFGTVKIGDDDESETFSSVGQ